MKEIIQKIEEVECNSWLGFRIETSKKVIELKISNERDCCEDWGCMSTEDDDLNRFVGQELLELNTTEADTHTTFVKDLDKMDIDSGRYEFITLKTPKRVLQFAVYDNHNGYYGHEVKIEVTDRVRP